MARALADLGRSRAAGPTHSTLPTAPTTFSTSWATRSAAITLTDLGWHHGRLGNHGEAIDLCEQALVLHQKLGNRTHEAHTLSCLADTHVQMGDPTGAIPCYDQALDLFRKLGDLYGEASTLAHLGACHHLVDDHAAAHEQWRHAHALLGDLDPSTTDQIHTQLTTIDKSAADAFASAADSVNGRSAQDRTTRTRRPISAIGGMTVTV